jgi:hypothetical protein
MMDREGSKQLQNIIRVRSYLFNDFDMGGTVARMFLKCPKLNELYIIFPADRWQSNTSTPTGTRDRRHQRQSRENGIFQWLVHDRFAHGDGQAQIQPSARSLITASRHWSSVSIVNANRPSQQSMLTSRLRRYAFPQLYRLAVNFDYHTPPSLRGNHHLSWSGVKLPALRYVSLSNLSTDSESMLGLLCSNSGTLATPFQY